MTPNESQSGARTAGERGEMIALQCLQAKGYRLIERNFRCRFGEIDLIVRDDAYVVFVEVKLRKTDAYGSPLEAVTPQKQRKLRLTAELWMAGHETALLPRFDVVGILAPRGAKAELRIEHIENAF